MRTITKTGYTNSQNLTSQDPQNATSDSIKMGLRKLPLAFTEQGVYMLSTVLKSKVAIDVTINIMRIFTKMKYFLQKNSHIFNRFEKIEYKLILQDKKIEKLFKAIEDKSVSLIKVYFTMERYSMYIVL